MLQEISLLLTGRATTPDPMNEWESLYSRFANKNLLAFHISSTGIEAFVVKFKLNADRSVTTSLESPELVGNNSDPDSFSRAMSDYAQRNHSTHAVIVYSAYPTAGSKQKQPTPSLTPRIKLKPTPHENLVTYRQDPDSLLGEAKHSDSEHVMVCHPEFNSAIKFDISADNIAFIKKLCDSAGIEAVRVRFGMADLLNSFLDYHYQSVGNDAVFFYVAPNMFFLCKIGPGGFLDASYRASIPEATASTVIQERFTDLLSTSSRMILVNESTCNLDDQARKLAAVRNQTDTAPTIIQPYAEIPRALIHASLAG